MSTTETVTLNITGNAVQTLQRLETQMGKVTSKFAAFRNLLGGIAISSTIARTLQYADAIQDLSNATGIATANVLGFQRAVQLNGGTIEGAQNALTKFNLSIGEAAQGSASAQQAFAKAGVTLQDLATLSEQQLFDKVIKGLSQITDQATAAKIANELFGKSLRGVELAKLSAAYESASTNVNASAIKAGADAFDNAIGILDQFKQALLNVLEPINNIAKNIKITTKALETFITLIISATASFLIFTKIVPVLLGISTAFFEAGIAAKGLGVAFKNILKPLFDFFAILGMVFGRLSNGVKIITRITTLFAVFFTIFARFLGLIGVVYTAITALKFLNEAFFKNDGIKSFTDRIDQAIRKLTDFIGLTEKADFSKPLFIQGAGAQAAPTGFNDLNEYFKSTRDQADKTKREVIDANLKLKNSIKEIGNAYRKTRADREQSMEDDVTYALLPPEIVQRLQAQKQASDEVMAAVEELRKKKADLGKENQNEINLINKEIDALLKTIPAAKAAADIRIVSLQMIEKQQQDLLDQTEKIKQALADDASLKQLRDQMALIGLYGDELENANVALSVTQTLEESLLKLRNAELDLLAKKAKMTEDQFNQEWNNIQLLKQAAYEKAGAEIDAKTQAQQATRQADDDVILSLEKYFDTLDKGTTKAKIAVAQTESVFQNMQTALDEFARTGKFKFKDFALTVIRDLLLIQAQAQLTAIFSTIGKFFTAAFAGRAAGGPVKGNQPYVVGEKGPELFVPKSAGTIIPNNKMNQGQGVGGPAQNTYITYNINAVDAKSVAQLFAENRKTLLGTVRLAEKEMPYA